jgi:quercetin dioxygenase-like cupin family protein
VSSRVHEVDIGTLVPTDGDQGVIMHRAIVLAEGEGQVYNARGSELVFKAGRATTDGRFSFMDRTLPPGGRRPPKHVHVGASEAFYVLEGEIEFWLDDDTTRQGPGAFVLVPGGVSHSFANAGPAPARLLILHAPAMDAYFQELHDLWLSDEPPTPEAEKELMRRHGMVTEA